MSDQPWWVEIPKPTVERRCAVCLRAEPGFERDEHGVVNMAAAVEHAGRDYGLTACGKDATGAGWWWPL